MENIVLAAILLIALFYLGRKAMRASKSFTSKQGGCSNCGCSNDTEKDE